MRVEIESERAARAAAEEVALRIQLEEVQAVMESDRRERAAERAELEKFRKGSAEMAAREAADAMVRQHQLVRTWLDIERELEQAKVGLCVELWEVALCPEHEAVRAKVNGSPPAAPEDFFLRVDAKHVLQR